MSKEWRRTCWASSAATWAKRTKWRSAKEKERQVAGSRIDLIWDRGKSVAYGIVFGVHGSFACSSAVRVIASRTTSVSLFPSHLSISLKSTTPSPTTTTKTTTSSTTTNSPHRRRPLSRLAAARRPWSPILPATFPLPHHPARRPRSFSTPPRSPRLFLVQVKDRVYLDISSPRFSALELPVHVSLFASSVNREYSSSFSFSGLVPGCWATLVFVKTNPLAACSSSSC